jgi:hypothetical protein
MQDKIALDRLTVFPDRVEAYVRIVDPCARTTSKRLIDQALLQFPTLPYHACRNEIGPTFSAVMEETSVPHLIEHLVIDIQTHAHNQKRGALPLSGQVVFTGTTQWSTHDPDVAIVRVSFLDDLIALGAFKKALHFINKRQHPASKAFCFVARARRK